MLFIFYVYIFKSQATLNVGLQKTNKKIYNLKISQNIKDKNKDFKVKFRRNSNLYIAFYYFFYMLFMSSFYKMH